MIYMLKQSQQLRLLQKLSPQQIQLMKLVQLPISELEQRIKEEIENNPALESMDDPDIDNNEQDNVINDFDEKDVIEDFNTNNQDNEIVENNYDDSVDEYLNEDDDIPDYKLYVNNSSDEDTSNFQYYSNNSLIDSLIEQLDYKNLNEKERIIGEYIIGNIDDNGYLQRSVDAIVNDLLYIRAIQTDQKEVEKVLNIIQQFDPPGIAARNLQECLLLQLRAIPQKTPEVLLAIEILENYYEEFTKKHYDQIIKKANINE